MLQRLIGICLLASCSAQAAVDWEKVFPDAVTSSTTPANINISSGVGFTGTDEYINFSSISDNSKTACIGICQKSNEVSQGLTLPTFQSTRSNTAETIDSNTTLNMASEYQNLTIKSNKKVTLKPNGAVTLIKNFSVQSNAEITIYPGVYFIENLDIARDVTINFEKNDNKGVLFLTKNVNINRNVTIGRNKRDPYLFGLVSYQTISFGRNVEVYAFIYAKNNVQISRESKFEGAVAAPNLNIGRDTDIILKADDLKELKNYDTFSFLTGTESSYTTPNLHSYWSFNYVSPDDDNYPGDSKSLDRIGNNDLELMTGAVHQNNSRYCEGIFLNGEGAHLKINNQTEMRGSSGSLSFWVKPYDLSHSYDSSHGGQYLFSMDSLGFDTGGHFTSWLESDGSLHLRYQTNARDYFIATDDRLFVDDTWAFITVTWGEAGVVLYFNGEQVGKITGVDATLRNNKEPMIFGANARVSEDEASTPAKIHDYFRGEFDDIKWFDGVMSAADIAALKITENDCIPTTNSGLVAEYRFADDDWSDRIEDTSGNAFHAAYSGEMRLLTPVNNMSCGTMDVPPNTNQNTPDFLDTPVDMDDDVGPEGTISFWFKSNSGWQDERDRTIFDAVQITQASTKHPNNKYFYLQLLEEGKLEFGYETSNDADTRFESQAFNFPEFTWVHIALTYDYDDREVAVFLNGEEYDMTMWNQDKNARWTGIMPDYGNIAFGDNRTDYITASSSANGRFDDIRIYNFKQNSAQIKNDMLKADACAVLYGYRITHPDQALTCDSAPVKVEACKNADCSELYEHEVQVSMSPTPNGDDEGLTYNFSREMTFDIVHRTAETKTITFTPMHHAKAEELTNTCSNNCEIEFVDAGLQMYINDTPPQYSSASPLQYQITKFAHVGGRDLGNVKMRAVRDNNGVCEAALVGQQNVDLTYSCYSYNALGLPVTGCAVGFGPFARDTRARDITNTAQLTFDANGTTTLTGFTLADAQNFTLKAHINKDGANLQSNMLDIEFIPEGILLSHDIEDSHKAGDTFTFKALGYGENQIPLPSYNFNRLSVKADRVAPVNGPSYGSFRFFNDMTVSTNPLFDLAVPFTNFFGSALRMTNGQFAYDQAMFNEVGAFEVTFTDQRTYGDIVSNTLQIGPFTPAYFDVEAVYTPIFADASSGFTYIGQPFTFDIGSQPKIKVTAYNVMGTVVNNYYDTTWELTPTASSVLNDVAYVDQSGTGVPLTLTSTPTDPILTGTDVADGVGYIELNNIDLTYTKQALPTPAFATDINIVLDADFLTDTHGVCYQPSYPNGCADFTWTNVSGTEQRYGKLQLENTFGPENVDLRLPMQAQYFTNLGWMTNTLDNSTNISMQQTLGQITLALHNSENDVLGSFTTIASSGTLVNGFSKNTDLTFTAPDLKSALQVTLHPNVGSPDWAKYLNIDWDGDGDIDADDKPSATINFGIYRGKDRKINFREVMP